MGYLQNVSEFHVRAFQAYAAIHFTVELWKVSIWKLKNVQKTSFRRRESARNRVKEAGCRGEIGSAPPASEDEEKRAKSPEIKIVLVDCSLEFYLDVPADFVFFDQLVLVDVLDASDEKGWAVEH